MKKSLQNRSGFLRCAVVALALAGLATAAWGQKKATPAPYASIASKGVTYAGPGRQPAFDLQGRTIHIGLLAPLHGPQEADGRAILVAAQMALRDANRRPLPGGRRLALSIADESVPPWGPLGDEIIHLIFANKVVGIVTGADGVAAHLSEQIGNKIGVPVLTLSGDPSTTEIDLPWIFRLGPSDVVQARAFARDIYRVRGLRHVLLVTGNGHDGRYGGRAFLAAAQRLGAPAPDSLLINPLQPDARSLLARVRQQPPQAIVFWTLPENARMLIAALRQAGIRARVYLSQEAAQQGSGLRLARAGSTVAAQSAGLAVYTTASAQAPTPASESFGQRYRRETGIEPSAVAAEAYDAVRLVASAVRATGPNRARVRDQVAGAVGVEGVSGAILFDSQGNNRSDVQLVRLRRFVAAPSRLPGTHSSLASQN